MVFSLYSIAKGVPDPSQNMIFSLGDGVRLGIIGLAKGLLGQRDCTAQGVEGVLALGHFHQL